MREKILNVMKELLQRNIICNYLVKTDSEEIYLPKLHSIDAYMFTYDKALNEGNCYCYMAPLGTPASMPVFEVENGIIRLSGQTVGLINQD